MLKKHSGTIALLIAVLIPFCIYLRYVYTYALNIPRQDDYDAILLFVTSFKNAGLSQKLSLLFMQHNEHRILFSRLVFVTYYYLFHEINFRHLIFINAGILSLLFLNISYFIKKAAPTTWRESVTVLSMCLFALSHFENMDFAMGGMQNFGIILLFTGSLFFYSIKNKWAVVPAIIMQLVCIYSSGNGMIAAAIIVLFNMLSKDRIRILASLITLLLFAPLYYYHYAQPDSRLFTLDPFKFIPYFLHTAGGYFTYNLGIAAAIILLTSVAFTAPFGKRMDIHSLPLVCLTMFVIASIGVMAVFRANAPLWGFIGSRYNIYPHLLVAMAFVFFSMKLQSGKVTVFLQLCLFAVLLLFYKHNCDDGAKGFKYFKSQLTSLRYDYPDSVGAKKIVDEACNAHVYCIERYR